MVEKIGELVRDLVAVVFVAALLEMLLPRGSFNRYLRLVTGLLAILMVVTFIGNLIDRRQPPSLAAISIPAGVEGEGPERGEELWELNQERALAVYRSALREMIEEEILLEKNWVPLRIDLEIEEDQSSPLYGSIYRVRVEIGSTAEAAGLAESDIQVEPVKIGPEGEVDGAVRGERRVPELELLLARRLQLSLESIQVWAVEN